MKLLVKTATQITAEQLWNHLFDLPPGSGVHWDRVNDHDACICIDKEVFIEAVKDFMVKGEKE